MNPQKHQILETNWKNGITLGNEKCETYKDCFNCTLSRCDWTADSKCVSDKYKEKKLYLNQFMNDSVKCPDRQNLCEH